MEKDNDSTRIVEGLRIALTLARSLNESKGQHYVEYAYNQGEYRPNPFPFKTFEKQIEDLIETLG